MSRYHSYINSALEIIGAYPKGMPLAHHLKKSFAAHKKFGSKDRKFITEICYAYFRCFALFPSAQPDQQQLLHAYFICNQSTTGLVESIDPELNTFASVTASEKISRLNYDENRLYTFKRHLSPSIDSSLFAKSLLIKPDLFVRIRPGFSKQVLNQLTSKQSEFRTPAADVIALAPGTKVEELFRINREVVVQDLQSASVMDWLNDAPDLIEKNKAVEVWDACAASGGKSILINDRLGGNLRLTVSDIRKSILVNLKNRLAEAGVKIFHQFVQDLSVTSGLSESILFDLIICDVPCSGSGTWGRTPEQHYSFQPGSVEEFSSLQSAIASNAIRHINKDGHFIYITCSVFEQENEQVVNWLCEKHSMIIKEMKYLKGYEKCADTLFVAVLTKA